MQKWYSCTLAIFLPTEHNAISMIFYHSQIFGFWGSEIAECSVGLWRHNFRLAQCCERRKRTNKKIIMSRSRLSIRYSLFKTAGETGQKKRLTYILQTKRPPKNARPQSGPTSHSCCCLFFFPSKLSSQAVTAWPSLFLPEIIPLIDGTYIRI